LNTSPSCSHKPSDKPAAYYYPIANRPNLHVYTKTVARRITWSKSPHHKNLQANCVQIISADGTLSHICARLEVILSAGAFISPLLFEASGIGNPFTLSIHSLPLAHPLSSVGENLQDPPNTNAAYLSSRNATGYPPYVTYATAADLFGTNLSAVRDHTYASIPVYAAARSAFSSGAFSSAAQQVLLRQQADFIFKHNVAVAEILTPAMDSMLLTAFWDLLPFLRGSVHINTLEDGRPPTPAINPNSFQFEWDAILQSATVRLARRALQSTPLSGIAATEVSPGEDAVPLNVMTDRQWTKYSKRSFMPNYHPGEVCDDGEGVEGRGECGGEGVWDGECEGCRCGNLAVSGGWASDEYALWRE